MLKTKLRVRLSVVSQHRFDDASRFLVGAVRAGRLGRLLQCDAYVKWYRSPEYYSRPIKGSWATEGGGALMNQAIHSVDLLRWIGGPLRAVSAYWQLGGLHKRLPGITSDLTYTVRSSGRVRFAFGSRPRTTSPLILRLQDVIFGEPSGPTGTVKASFVPLFIHLLLVLIAGLLLPGPIVRWFQTVAAQLGGA